MSNLRPRKDRPDYKALNQGIKQVKSEPLPESQEDPSTISDDCQQPSISELIIDPDSPRQEDYLTPAQTEEERAFRYPSSEADSEDTPTEELAREVS